MQKYTHRMGVDRSLDCRVVLPSRTIHLVLRPVILGISLLIGPALLYAVPCTGPALLEARIHTHPDADAYTALGTWFGDHQKTDCAVQTFQAAVKLQPDSAGLSYLLGLSLYTAGRPKEAIEPLQHSIRIYSKEVKAHILLASAFAATDQPKEAFNEWQAALSIDPNSKIALDGIAKIVLAAGDYETVINRLSPIERDENLTLDLAIAYGKAGLLDDAVRVLTDGLKAYPNSDRLTTTLETVYVKQLRYQEASKIAEQLASRNPHDIEAQRSYLRILVLNGENDTAVPLARKLLALAPHDADFLYLNGVLERTAGDYTLARKHLEEAVARNPNHYNSRYNLGIVLDQLQEYAAAKEQLLKSLELGATEPEIRFETAKVLRKLGETEAAKAQLEIYQKELKSKSDHTLAAQKSTQAQQALQAGDKQKAAALYRDALAVLPDNAGLAYQLAMVLNDLGDMEAERAVLEQAVQSEPEFSQAQYQLGYVESRAGDAAGAEKQFRLALKAAPGNVQAWIALSATLAMQSRFPEAKEAIANALKIDPNNEGAIELSKNLSATPAQAN